MDGACDLACDFSDPYMDSACIDMLSTLQRLSDVRKTKVLVREQIKKYQEVLKNREEWMFPLSFNFQALIEDEGQKLRFASMEECTLKHKLSFGCLRRATLLHQGNLIMQSYESSWDWNNLPLMMVYERQYRRYRNMKRAVRMQPKRGCGIIKYYK